jgi:CDP-diacylglycerol--glycerol-3-phosphate 3-phosphatidyltransferase
VAGPPLENPHAGASERLRGWAGRRGITRVLGFDRSAEPAAPTAASRPLRPLTIPNAITFTRLALVPVFLVLGLTLDHGQAPASVVLFAVIGWSDFADGAMARITGQYSRLGAMLDPATDRLLAISGVAVCWRWSLLPRWALAVLLAREVSMLLLGRYALRHGLDLRISRLGRLALVPVMGALFFAMAGLETLGEVLLYIGIVLAIAATVGYVRTGVAQLRARAPGPAG